LYYAHSDPLSQSKMRLSRPDPIEATSDLPTGMPVPSGPQPRIPPSQGSEWEPLQTGLPPVRWSRVLGFRATQPERRVAWDDAATRRSSAARCWTWSKPAGRSLRVAQALGISDQSIYTWRRQDRIDRGLEWDVGGRMAMCQLELPMALLKMMRRCAPRPWLTARRWGCRWARQPHRV
jgi:hypothetical protein